MLINIEEDLKGGEGWEGVVSYFDAGRLSWCWPGDSSWVAGNGFRTDGHELHYIVFLCCGSRSLKLRNLVCVCVCVCVCVEGGGGEVQFM